MDLVDAFSAVEHLASEHCLFIARDCGARDGGDPRCVEWTAGDIRGIARLRGIEFASEIGSQLMQIYDEFSAGTSRILACMPMQDATVRSSRLTIDTSSVRSYCLTVFGGGRQGESSSHELLAH
jgi:hypothetical protein